MYQKFWTIGIKAIRFILICQFSSYFFITSFAQPIQVLVQSGNDSEVQHIEFAPDGKSFLTLDLNNVVKLWDTNTGIDYLSHQNDNIQQATFSENGDLLTLDFNFDYNKNKGRLTIFNISNNSIELNQEFDSLYLQTAKLSANSRYLYLSLQVRYQNQDGTTSTPFIYQDFIYDILKEKYHYLDVEVTSVNFSSNNEIISLRRGEEIQIYDFSSLDFLKSINSKIFDSPSLEDYISPNGKYFLSRYQDSVRIWNIDRGLQIQSIQCDWQQAPIAFSHNNELVAIVDHQSFNNASTIKLIKISSGQIINVIKTDKTESLDFSNDGRYIISSGINNSIMLWKGNDGNLIRSVINDNEVITDIKFLNNGLSFLSVGEVQESSVKPRYIKFWDLNTAQLNYSFKAHESTISSIVVSSENNKIIYGGYKYRKAKIYDFDTRKIRTLKSSDIKGFSEIDIATSGELMVSFDSYISNLISIWDLNKKRKIGNSIEMDYEYSPNQKFFDLANDGKKLAFKAPENNINIIDPRTGVVQKSVQGDQFSYFSFSPDNNLLGYVKSDTKLSLYDIQKEENIKELSIFIENSDYRYKYSIFEFSHNSKLIAFKNIDSDYVDVFDIESNQRIFHFYEPKATNWIFSKDSKMLAIYSQPDKWINIYNLNNNDLVSKIETNNLKHLVFTPDNKFIITYGEKSHLSLWDYNSGQKIVDIYSFYPDQFVTITPDNYYSLSRNSYKNIAFFEDNQIFPFDQFDLQFNRPDIILERIGLVDTTTIEMYRKAYYKRLKKMNIDESMFSPDFHNPELVIKGKDKIPFITNSQSLEIVINALESKYTINRINVWINDVAAYGQNGLSVSSQKSGSVEKIIDLKLSQGKNKIQVSCLNDKGVESLKETIEVTYEPSELIKPNLHLVALSVSEYQQTKMNLKYAVKDGRDLISLLAKSNAWGNINIDTLFDKNATRENIIDLKQKLLNTKVDDQVVLFVSGHGLLDDNFDFYFATHDIDFDNPAERGISYDQLEWLLDSIPARKKLFMMDACHSGEVDKEELIASNSQKGKDPLKKGIKSYTYRAMVLEEDKDKSVGLQNSFELMQELFANLNRGSGAFVISAAAGDSYALESDEWNNGVFTYSVLDGIKNEHADLNNDGEITVSELRSYVSKKVQEETGGRQKPTARQENVEFDFRVW